MAATTTISKDNDVVTLINIFTVEPENQQRLVDLLVDVTETTMSEQPGFVSANIHKSPDGTHVANYAQWRTLDAFQAMLNNREAQVHMNAVREIAQSDAYLYNVVETMSAS